MRAPTACRFVALSAMILSLVPVPGCSRTPPSPAPSATAVLVDMDGAKHVLPQVESDYLAGLTAAAPDTDTKDHLSLDPPYRVLVEGLDLALEPDELILMHPNGTRRWNAPGVRKRILAAVGK